MWDNSIFEVNSIEFGGGNGSAYVANMLIPPLTAW